MNKFMFETTDAAKARRIMDILAEGVSHAAVAPSAAAAPVAPRPQAVAATTPPAAPPAPPAAPPAPPAAPPAPPAAPAAPPAPPAAPPAPPAAPPAPPAAPPAPPAAPAAPPAPPAAPAAPPAPPAAAGSITKEELIKRMGSYVSQGLPVATIRQINTQLCGQPNSQALPEDQLANAMAQYDAAFAAYKGA